MSSFKDVHIDLLDAERLDGVWHRQRSQLQNRHRRCRIFQRPRLEIGPDGNPLPSLANAPEGGPSAFFHHADPNAGRGRLPRGCPVVRSHPPRAPGGGVWEPTEPEGAIPSALPVARLPGLVGRSVGPSMLEIASARKTLPVGFRSERISIEGDLLCYNSDKHVDGRVGSFVAADPLRPGANYFEVEILDTGSKGAIGIGLAPKTYPLDRQPGWNHDSVAFHADDGKLFKCNGQGRPFGTKCRAGDRIGCGIKFDQILFECEKDDAGNELDEGSRSFSASVRRKTPAEFARMFSLLPSRRETMVPVFFTQNGVEIGTVLMPMAVGGLHPAVGMHSEGEEVRLVLDARWSADEGKMVVDTEAEEEWSRLHDMRINIYGDAGVLEYTGKGKTISDVGLAIARNALDTSNHYFEVEIVDPGDNCYIAVGLVRKNYPKKRHPGWNQGSIAYHADDGKLFTGSGAGSSFGPRCKKGDVMGCGILFPPDFSPDGDADDEADDGDETKSSSSAGSSADDDESQNLPEPFSRVPADVSKGRRLHGELEDFFDSVSESDSDSSRNDGAIGGGHLPCKRRGLRKRSSATEDDGPRVSVFFTRNGQLVGKREAPVPFGGFFPCVGMLSADEKVRVDLHPLTG